LELPQNILILSSISFPHVDEAPFEPVRSPAQEFLQFPQNVFFYSIGGRKSTGKQDVIRAGRPGFSLKSALTAGVGRISDCRNSVVR